MSIDEYGSFDVVIVGSGVAGSSAAIACATMGARTLLIEKLPFLGGNSTAVLDTFYGFYTPGERAIKVVGGIGDEVVAELRRIGTVLERPNTYGAGTGITYVAEHLKVVWENLVVGAGAAVLLHAFVQDVVVAGGRVVELVVATKAGLRRVGATVVIDASGDADVCARAGFGYEAAGTIDPAQTLTTTFRMANVDPEARASIGKERLHGLMAEAADSGEYDLPRREGSDHVTPIPGVTATVMTRIDQIFGSGVSMCNATDPDVLTRAEMEGRRQAL
ncbi:MAG TPA: FAD-dependent oxidoreductase, partial [Actinobacteria bacterium]|nr:FAD-dependent oxidoreductase [Actinomycetota bacterium]